MWSADLYRMVLETSVAVGPGFLHVRRYGQGDELLIGFHGFGEDGRRFAGLLPALPDGMSLCAVDLPFHGQSRWPPDALLLPEHVHTLVSLLQQRSGARRVHLLAYSIGARLALTAAQHGTWPATRIILLAPDGLQRFSWYHAAVYSFWGRHLFRRFVEQPQPVFRLADVLHTAGLLPAGLHRMLYRHAATKEQRLQVYQTWMALRALKPRRAALQQQAITGLIKLIVVAGRHDKVLSFRSLKRFVSVLPDAVLIPLECGHHLRNDAVVPLLRKLLA